MKFTFVNYRPEKYPFKPEHRETNLGVLLMKKSYSNQIHILLSMIYPSHVQAWKQIKFPGKIIKISLQHEICLTNFDIQISTGKISYVS